MKRIVVLVPSLFFLILSVLTMPALAHLVNYTQIPPGPLYANRYDFTVTHNWSPNGNPIRGFHIDSNGATIHLVSSPLGWVGVQSPIDPNLIFWYALQPYGNNQISPGSSKSGFVIDTDGVLGVAGGFFLVWGTHSGVIITAGFLDSGTID